LANSNVILPNTLLFQAQLVLLAILSLAVINFFVGTFIPPDDEKKWKGVVGYNGKMNNIFFV
jgi:hypothetical protein